MFKKIINYLSDLTDAWCRGRAAYQLSRMGHHKQAKEILLKD